jgi:hypothetical protein
VAETTGITDVDWLDQKVCELSAAIEQRDQIIAGLLEAIEPFTTAASVYDQEFLCVGGTRRLRDDEKVSDLDTNFKVGDLRALSEAASKAREVAK